MPSSATAVNWRGAPVVTELQVIPVAGHDSMLLNLSGAHGPFFTRNLIIVGDSANRTGVGEVPAKELELYKELCPRLARPLVLFNPVFDNGPDGGWGQLPTMASDAYATGQALYALHAGGLTTTYLILPRIL